MRTTDFSKKLFQFLNEYLPTQRNYSHNTVSAYCIAFKLLMIFCKTKKNLDPSRFQIRDFSKLLILDYLNWLQNERNCCMSTLNQRLAAIHSFMRFVDVETPENLFEMIQIQKIPYRKIPAHQIVYLSVEDTALLLRQPNPETIQGRRHQVILCLLYDTAGRAQEIADLTIRNLHLLQEKIVITGKGRKVRELPLSPNTVKLLQQYVNENKLNTIARLDQPLFLNHMRQKFNRAGIAYILAKYAQATRNISHTVPEKVTPHVIRRTKAMHMLEAGVPKHIIQDFLGHADISTTNRYAQANLAMKKQALNSTNLSASLCDGIDYLSEPDIFDWLSSYAKECSR